MFTTLIGGQDPGSFGDLIYNTLGMIVGCILMHYNMFWVVFAVFMVYIVIMWIIVFIVRTNDAQFNYAHLIFIIITTIIAGLHGLSIIGIKLRIDQLR
jgi:bacteriorhodopsin